MGSDRMVRISKDTLMKEAEKVGAKVYKSWSAERMLKEIEKKKEKREADKAKEEEEAIDETVKKAKEDVKEESEEKPNPPLAGEDEPKTTYPCEHCDEIFSDTGDLVVHVEEVHMCHEKGCGFVGPIDALEDHVEKEHPPEPEEPPTHLSRRQRRKMRHQ